MTAADGMLSMLPPDSGAAALISGDIILSGRQVMERISGFASGINVRKGSRVILCSENRPEWIFAFYAIWIKGGITVPVDAAVSAEDLTRIMKNCSPDLIICSEAITAVARKTVKSARPDAKIITLEKLAARPDKPGMYGTRFNPSDTALIMYTSGTTGPPKGVMLSFDNLDASINGVASLGMITSSDRMLALLPFHHIFPLQGSIIAPMRIGTTIVFSPGLAPAEIMEVLQKHKVTIFLGVPKLYELFHAGILRKINESAAAKILYRTALIINSRRFGEIIFSRVHKSFGGHIHSWLTGGAPMNRDVARGLGAIGFRLVEGYGLTETAPLVAFNRAGELKTGSVGKPLKGTEVKISDGEILVRGRNVMKGYYRNPAATAEKIKDGWFHTGDRGHFDSAGYLYVTGRVDEMIVFPNGKKIHPEEIESRIMSSSPFIKDIGVYDAGGVLACVIQPDLARFETDGSANIKETIRWKVIDRFNQGEPAYKRIHGISVTREDLPRTRLGKMKRYMLKNISSVENRHHEAEHRPDTQEYKMISGFISKLTEADVTPDSHFELDLALDSLSMIELTVFIESAFGINITEPVLAKYPTPRMLAEYAAGARTRISAAAGGWEDVLNGGKPHTASGSTGLISMLKAVTAPVFMSRIKFRHRGTELLPESPFILAPNHQSYMDVLLVAKSLPDKILKDTYFIARDSLTRSAVMRFVIKRTNVILVNIDSDLKDAVRKSASAIRAGKNLVIFPEGHRTRDGKIAPFKKLFAILSMELKVPVVPVAITGAFDVFPPDSVIPGHGRVELVFCEPVNPVKKNYDALALKVRTTINSIVSGTKE